MACMTLLAFTLFDNARCKPVLPFLQSEDIKSTTQTVTATHYQQFWLWTGVKGQSILNHADSIYLHQGEFTIKDGVLIHTKQGLPIRQLNPNNTPTHLWLTLRVIDLEQPELMVKSIESLIHSWQAAGNQIYGIQLDFDAASRKLNNYAIFLREFRQFLPESYKLSITGLLDWAKTGDINVLNQLKGTLDELVIQTYQGKITVKEYESYLPALLKLRIPFKIGLVQDGYWNRKWEEKLKQSEYYFGEVIFLVN